MRLKIDSGVSLAALSRQLDEDGFIHMESVLSANELAAAREDIATYIERHGKIDRDLFDPEQWDCPVAYSVATDPSVESHLHSLAFQETGQLRQGGYVRRVLRIFSGPGSVLSKPKWHYDGCSITMVVPIVMPEDGSGGFAAFPNSRPHRRSFVATLAEKQVYELNLLRPWINRRFRKNQAAKTIKFIPGDAYIFRGYRTLHSIMPLSPASLRVSVLLQYGRPYGTDNKLIHAARTAKHRYLHMRGGTKPSAPTRIHAS